MKPWQWALCLPLVVVGIIVTWEPVGGKTPPEPRYNVVKEVGDVTLYLTFSGERQRFRVLWVVDSSMAWRFADRVSAQGDVDQYGGWIVAAKEGAK